MLTNFLSNAIRYSYDNSIIYVSVEKTNGRIRISVKDTGQGISTEFITKMFDRYFRIPGTKKKEPGRD
ncbi:MAG: ATP-binding protein [Agriterribacter sp.]